MNEILKIRIVELRLARKWTRQELSKRLHVDIKTIFHWEKGDTLPSEPNLARLSELFSVSTDYILGKKTNNSINLDSLPEKEKAKCVAIFQTYLSYTDLSE